MRRIFKMCCATFIASLVCLSVTSCRGTYPMSFVHADAISFGDNVKANFDTKKSKGEPYKLYEGDLSISAENDMKHKFKSEAEFKKLSDRIDNVVPENNTAGIYAMDVALKRVKHMRKEYNKDINVKYAIVYLTDGLDNVSVQVAKNNKGRNYRTADNYKKIMKKKIKRVSRCKKDVKNQFDIYPIVYTGTDLGDVRADIYERHSLDINDVAVTNQKDNTAEQEFGRFIDHNMDWLRGSSNGFENSPEIVKAEDWGKILEDFQKEYMTNSFMFMVPKGYLKKDVEMTMKDDNGNEVKFTGTLNKRFGKYFLKDVRTGGDFTIADKTEIKKMKSINKSRRDELATFVIAKPKFNGEPFSVSDDLDAVVQRYRDFGQFVKNSEYSRQAKSEIKTYVQFIFDCSASMDNSKEEEIVNGEKLTGTQMARRKLIEMAKFIQEQSKVNALK